MKVIESGKIWINICIIISLIGIGIYNSHFIVSAILFSVIALISLGREIYVIYYAFKQRVEIINILIPRLLPWILLIIHIVIQYQIQFGSVNLMLFDLYRLFIYFTFMLIFFIIIQQNLVIEKFDKWGVGIMVSNLTKFNINFSYPQKCYIHISKLRGGYKLNFFLNNKELLYKKTIKEDKLENYIERLLSTDILILQGKFINITRDNIIVQS